MKATGTFEVAPASLFWQRMAKKSRTALDTDGYENLKRTVGNSYFNFIVLRPNHHLFRRAFRLWLSKPDAIPFRTSLAEFSVSHRKKVSVWRRHIYRLYVSMVWSIMKSMDRLRLHDRIAEPTVGNPLPVKLGEKIISQDLANSILECNMILSELRPTKTLRIAEIGAGYGRLAYVFKQAVDCEYTIFDIEPALSVSRWYLDETLGKNQVDTRAAHEITSFPDSSFDLIVSISTLPEMSNEQVEFYIRQFSRLSSDAIFLKQWKNWKNPDDGTELTIDGYNFGKDFIRTRYETDLLNHKFFNAMWRR